ncbi:hypothetical protein [Georgenia sp. SUBG003]|uniref:hypothetical protein n=1 Tax=Georgenia sp. SUBG003 TaxID=1497974 RepID=UPI003AB719CE
MNVSEGRGTTTPFLWFGAPYIDETESYALAEDLNARGLEGVTFRPMSATPSASKHAGRFSGGVQVHVLDEAAYEPCAPACTSSTRSSTTSTRSTGARARSVAPRPTCAGGVDLGRRRVHRLLRGGLTEDQTLDVLLQRLARRVTADDGRERGWRPAGRRRTSSGTGSDSASWWASISEVREGRMPIRGCRPSRRSRSRPSPGR